MASLKTTSIPYSYRSGNTVLHRLPALFKLFILFFLSLCPFFFGIYAICAASILTAIGACTASLKIRDLLAGSRTLLISLAVIMLIRSFKTEAPYVSFKTLIDGFEFTWQIINAFCAAALFFATTTIREIRSAAAVLESGFSYIPYRILSASKAPRAKRMAKKLEQKRLSLSLTLMLAFLPRVFSVWDTIKTAYKARAGKEGIRSLLYIIPLLTERMIETAAETARALQARAL